DVGTGDCDEDGTCETNLRTSTEHCGTCGNPCEDGQACDGGTCTCPGGFESCDGTCTDVNNDVNNCGGCGIQCAAGSSCELGMCPSLSRFVHGRRHSCALFSDGDLRCWGDNAQGQVIPGSDPVATPFVASPQRIVLDTSVFAFALGDDFTCALVADQRVLCWGDNTFGQLGVEAGTQPEGGIGELRRTDFGINPDDPLDGLAGLQAGARTVYALRMGFEPPNEYFAWGAGDRGQLGTPVETPFRSTPELFTDGESTIRFSPIFVGDEFVCGYEPNFFGEGSEGVRCSGANDATQSLGPFGSDQLGFGDLFDFPGENVLSRDAGARHACVLVQDSDFVLSPRLQCWGDNTQNQIDDSPVAAYEAPTEIGGPPVVIQRLALGGNLTCIVGADGSAWCRGENVGGLVTGDDWNRLPLGMSVIELQCGERSCCAETTDGRVFCFGEGSNGRLGIGESSDASFPPRLVSGITP
ncbi:MAG: hypothetical protein AAF411_31625, partial [Myxococcota bacterium]